MLDKKSVAVIIPCFNEGKTISDVITGFTDIFPKKDIYVCDNNSTDDTKQIAFNCGVNVLTQPLQGKGYAVEKLFRVVDADYYIMVDGDATYDPKVAKGAVQKCITESKDMLVGVRVSADGHKTYKPFRSMGNMIFTMALKLLFSSNLNDTLSGFRVFSRRLVKSMPILSGGFGIETEMNIHALSLSLSIGEFETPYYERPVGSISKLHTVRDGAVIFVTISRMLFEHKPFYILNLIALLLAVSGGALLVPIMQTYFETGLVPRLPTAILSFVLIFSSMVSFFSGLILDGLSRQRIELKKMMYLKG
jgi:glycosyltransferase involved in cell wall biosynthesis